MTECICAIDQGTQSTRVIFFDKEANIISYHQENVDSRLIKDGWAEVNAHSLIDSIHICIHEAIKKAKVKDVDLKILCVGVANQRETAVAWDKVTGQQLCNAILWFDNRTSSICQQMREKFKSTDYFKDVTGLPISTYFSAYKYNWMLNNVDDVKEAVKDERCLLGTVDSWIIWNLTGGPNGGSFVTDVTNASRTNLMNLNTQCWSDNLLSLFGIKKYMLAKICSNSEVYGKITEGPLSNVPISGCIGDQQSALLGHSCKKSAAKTTYGTGCFLLVNTGEKSFASHHGLISTIGFKLGKKVSVQYALEGNVAVGGLGITWLKDNLGIINSPEESESLAKTVPNSGGVYFVPAFSGLRAPIWDDYARGVVLGLTTSTTSAHIVRAMLDGIAWQIRQVIDAMLTDYDTNEKKLSKLIVDGGASQNNLLMQIQADVLQMPVFRPHMHETTALGAAYAAGIGIGFWTPEWVLSRSDVGERFNIFYPEIDEHRNTLMYNKWKKAIQRSFDIADLAEM